MVVESAEKAEKRSDKPQGRPADVGRELIASRSGRSSEMESLGGVITGLVVRVAKEAVREMLSEEKSKAGERAYAVADAAVLLGLTEWQTREKCRKGVFGVKVGQRYRILESEINDFTKGRRLVDGEGK